MTQERKTKLVALCHQFRDAVNRDEDRGLADEIEHQIIELDYDDLSLATQKKLARWCKTNGNLYQGGMPIAQQISILLYGRILDRNDFNT